MSSLAQDIARFAVEAKFEDLPEAIVHEAKRVLLDSIGCCLGGIGTDKGKISIQMARRLGGPPESSIIGIGDKVSCCSAAFANGELNNALDCDSILAPTGHISPYVVTAPLAVAESVGASGRDLIVATVLAHEISARIRRAQPPLYKFVEGPEKNNVRWSPVFGNGDCIFGATAGAGKIMNLDYERMSFALGIAGHFCPVPTGRKFFETVPAAMTKYGSTGWLSKAAVTAAMLAEMGYIGDISVFDGEYGFWKFFASERWEPDAVMDKIGATWLFGEMRYKVYPCCRFFREILVCFINIIDKNNLLPEDIENVNVFCTPMVELPLWRNNELVTQIDAQFSIPYVVAAAAHRVNADVWQDQDTIRNPKILEFMKKVTYQGHPEFEEAVCKDPRSRVATVEVVAKGKKFSEGTIPTKGSTLTDVKTTGEKPTDEELVDKFRRNASRILTRDKIDKAAKSLLQLEMIESIPKLVKQVTL